MSAAQEYDSTADTLKHIRRVQHLLGEFAVELIMRGTVHDDSKLADPEKEAFDRETPLLKTLVYGSDEYKESLARLGPALQHHYDNNSHHPEHYENGVAGFDLADLVEMVLDWKAASERQAGATINLDVSFKRFNVDPQLASIILNTAKRLGWIA
jgi:hypothetical protein